MGQAKQIQILENAYAKEQLVIQKNEIYNFLGLLKKLPTSKETIILECNMNSVVLKEEFSYFEPLLKLCISLSYDGSRIEKSLLPIIHNKADMIYQYGTHIDEFYLCLHEILEKILENPKEKDLLYQKMNQELSALSSKAEDYRQDVVQIDTAIKSIITNLNDYNYKLQNIKECLEKEFLDKDLLMEMENNITEWNQEIIKLTNKKCINHKEALLIRKFQNDIQIIGYEYQRRLKLIEYMNIAFGFVEQAFCAMKEIHKILELFYGIWEAMGSDLRYIQQITEKEIRKADDFIKSLFSDYAKELWKNISKTAEYFI